MNRRQIALKLVLDELGMAPSLSTFDDRLILQKTVYLIQQLGVSLGYSYSWYIRGPYSRDLTADAFGELGGSLPDGWFLETHQKAMLAAAKPFIDSTRSRPDAARELEKLASVLFVIKTRQARPDDTDSITSRMTIAGKDFSKDEVEDAVRVLRIQRFLPQA